MTAKSGRKRKLFIELIPPDGGNIIPARVKKEVIKKRFGAVDRRRVSRAQPFIELNKRFLAVAAGVLFEGGVYALVVAENLFQLLGCLNTEFRAGDG